MNTLLTAIIFYFIGRYSVSREQERVLITKVKKKFKKRIKPGVIPFKTQEDFEDEKSGEKAIEKRWVDSGFGKLLKKSKT